MASKRPSKEPPPPAAPEAAPAGKNKKHKRPPQGPPIYLPRDADELIALDRFALDRLIWEVSLRKGKARRRRAALIAATPRDDAALTLVNGELAELGALMNCLHGRRGQLRGEARRAYGRVQERAEAIAAAVDLLVSGGMWRKLQAQADQILATAEKDLAAAGE